MKRKVIVGLTCALVSNFALATEFRGERINAFIDLKPELESKVIKILKLIELGLTQNELYEKFEETKNFTCLRVNQEDVTQIIKEANFNIQVYSDELGSSVTASTSGNQITINENFKQSDLNWSNTFFHEMLHVISFSHCGKNNPRIHKKILKSVPYKGGNYMEEVLKNLGGEL